MYTKKSFDKYPMFKDIINRYGMVNFLDPLTKTILRGHMMTYVDKLIREKFPFSLIILDIDNFKQINDNYGHQIGDRILQETAKNIIEYVGDSGLVGRYGGDEFIIFAKNINEEDIVKAISKLDESLKSSKDDLGYYVYATIGYSKIDSDQDIETAIEAADNMLYEKKEIAHKIR